MWVKSLRLTSIVLGACNLLVVVLGGILVAIAFPGCGHRKVLPLAMVSMLAAIKIGTMIKLGIAQEATAKTITDSPSETDVLDAVIRHDRRVKYKTWLWWSRFALVLTLLQILGAFYLLFYVARYLSQDGNSSQCFEGLAASTGAWKLKVMVVFMVTACCIAFVQCFTGSDVLRWRFFYATQDDAWKAHYQEVFDYGIREALCCLGRIEYFTVLEDDEVYSVAKLLGDLVAYRASGTGHLELLTGLALLQKHGQSHEPDECFVEAPLEHLQVAAAFHKFAEAAYTGPLLDFGRNPFVFPCAWLYRQGILTPWTRNRRPALDGDNWWRGHAAAFLKFVNLPPGVLRRGRVCQKKCEAAYFVVVLHHLRSVVIAVRGTETPEDLITDGLGRECPLSEMDLDGLINSSYIHPSVKQRVESSFPHYGHSGIVEAARDLYTQIEGYSGDECQTVGFLSSLLGAGCECDGYSLCIVGHSLGGAIAALLGIRLYQQFPNLHVYSYGPLPCIDSVVSDACSDFVTSIVHGNEFSARLSVGSILRLRAAAITALSENTKTNTALIFRLAHQFLYANNSHRIKIEAENPAEYSSEISKESKDQVPEFSLCHETDRRQNLVDIGDSDFINPFVDIGDSDFINPFAADLNRSDDPISQFMETVSRSENGSASDPTEMFLPGRVIHIVPQKQNLNIPLWKSWTVQENSLKYKAFLVNREDLKDIVVSPNMFFDHLPWRCDSAMRKVLEAENVIGALDVSPIV
ncbi:PREDICTED: sn1-specific diacylglycerol lipase beta isoform X1 [Theobroma cacao]|uniref:Sn1-specific diacylglycerol lipase beta isoform X1 n=1 Tax=Theobroma cacao TaxID=3641 RepID=A0AB32V8M1_THECC|nr:PREDICTED: sn1-specific diacylglycerol lipase beta isoform X1 [Theobroma cacao]